MSEEVKLWKLWLSGDFGRTWEVINQSPDRSFLIQQEIQVVEFAGIDARYQKTVVLPDGQEPSRELHGS
jgi:hypothetical protein